MADAADDSDTASVASSGEHSWAAKAADIDTGLEQIGVQRFHVWMVLVLGIGNASDAVVCRPLATLSCKRDPLADGVASPPPPFE